MSSKHVFLRTISQPFVNPRPFFHLRNSFSSSAHRERRDVASCIVEEQDELQWLPPDIDLSFMNNPGTSPEHFVDAVRRLKPSLPIGCELLGQGDLRILGSYPIDAGGFADVWLGEKSDGTLVAVKSHRYYSSSSCLPIYSVSSEYCCVLCLLKGPNRGCTRKHRYTVASTTTTAASPRSLGSTPPLNTHSPLSLNLWTISTLESI